MQPKKIPCVLSGGLKKVLYLPTKSAALGEKNQKTNPVEYSWLAAKYTNWYRAVWHWGQRFAMPYGFYKNKKIKIGFQRIGAMLYIAHYKPKNSTTI